MQRQPRDQHRVHTSHYAGVATRGTAGQLYDKYKSLALQAPFDEREGYLQQAEHWSRVHRDETR